MTNILINSTNKREHKNLKPRIEQISFKTIQERNKHLTEMLKKYKEQNEQHKTSKKI